MGTEAMSKCVILREDEPDLVGLVTELLEESDYNVVHVNTVQELLVEATRRAPCVALIDANSPSSFDLWWLGPILNKLGVPPVAFTAHSSAQREFAADPHGYVGLVSKPFDADEFLDLINGICWENYQFASA